MVRLLFEPRHKVILLEFSGTFTLAELARADALVGGFMAGRTQDMPAQDMPGIADFTRIEQIDVTSEQLSGRAQQPQLRRGQRRVLVASTQVSYGLCRMFAAFQAARGNIEPEIVRSMQAACALLGIEDARFEPATE
jgi:hypothetical protein